MILQKRTTTRAAFFVGDLRDLRKLKKPWTITLRVFEGGGRFVFTDESGEARLIVTAAEGTREIKAEDFAGALTGSHLRLSVADPVAGPWRRSGQARDADPRVTFQCSIT
jgi:hypothetical protein